MLNYCITQNLPGLDKGQFLCSCGHTYFDKWNLIKRKNCPVCGAKNIEDFDTIYFKPQTVKTKLVTTKYDKDNPYLLDIHFNYIEATVKTLYSKKKVEFVEKKCSQKHWKISFDGLKPRDKMITIANEITNETIEDASAIALALDECKTRNLIRDVEQYEIEKHTGFTMPDIYGADNLVNRITIIMDRLNKLADFCSDNELLLKIGINPYKLNGTIDYTKTTPSEQLGLQPFMFKFLKENGEQNHRALQFIQDNLDNQAVNYVNTFGTLSNGLVIYNIRKISDLVNRANLSIKKLYKFLYKEAPMRQGLYDPATTLTLLHDSFELASKLDLPFDKNPKALERYHDILTREYGTAKDEMKNTMFAKTMVAYKNMEYIERYEEEETEEQLALDGVEKPKKKKPELFGMILPVDAQDLIREGKNMRHCVASYVDRVIREDSIIFFLRYADALDKSYATVELDPTDYTIRQVKGKANTHIKNKKANDFLNKWCKKNNVKWNGQW